MASVVSSLGKVRLAQKRWYALYTMPNHERVVFTALRKKGVETFLPLHRTLRSSNGSRKWVQTPLFRSYVFVRVAPRSWEYYQAIDAPGCLYILSNRGEPLPIPDAEIRALQILVSQPQYELTVYERLWVGRDVLLVSGPFKGAMGKLVRVDKDKLCFVVNICLLGRSVSVEVDPGWVKVL